MTQSTRRAVLFAIPFLCLLAIAGTAAAWAGDLPDPIAIHWQFGGPADGFGSLWLSTGLLFALVGVLGLGTLALQQRVNGPNTRWLGGQAAGVSLFLTVVHIGTLRSNLAVETAERAMSPDAALVGGLAVFALGGLLGWWLGPEDEPYDPDTVAVDQVEVVPGEAVVWSGSAVAEQWLVVLAGAIIALGVVLLLVSEPWAAGVLVLAGFGVASLLRLRVTVGPAGVVARFGPFGVFRSSVPLTEVSQVTAEVVEPLAYGGWGYRLLPGTRAIVVRRGPGLRVERRDGPTLVVTVDDAGVAAGVLRAHLAAARD